MPDDKRDQIYDKVVRTVADIAGISLTDLRGDTELIVDLNLDSLGIFEIVIELEETFDMRITDEDIDRIKSIDQIVDYIARRETT
jgi:acyl carrier protein